MYVPQKERERIISVDKGSTILALDRIDYKEAERKLNDKKITLWPFLWMWFNCLIATEPLRGSSLRFTTDRPRKDERLNRPWSHPGVLNTEPLDWESSALSTRPDKNLLNLV